VFIITLNIHDIWLLACTTKSRDSICSEFSAMFRICSEFSAIFRICSEFSVMFRIFSNFQTLFRISSTKTGLFRIPKDNSTKLWLKRFSSFKRDD
jgi:hypothetical protein